MIHNNNNNKQINEKKTEDDEIDTSHLQFSIGMIGLGTICKEMIRLPDQLSHPVNKR